jgi:DNA adenine methylase
MDIKDLRPFFCRVGSKVPIRDIILKMIPPHKIYVEPFVGSGAIYWAKDPSDKEVLNDLDEWLIKNYKLLKNIKSRNFRDILGDDIKTKPEKIRVLSKFYNDPSKNSEADKLTKNLLQSCNTFGNVGKGGLYAGSNPNQKLKKIDNYQERLKNTTLLNEDYKTVIKKYDSPHTFFFMDPPYVQSKQLYKHATFNYEEMRDILNNIRGDFLLTLNDDPYIRKLFKGFKMKKVYVRGTGNREIGMGYRNELIIYNY